MCLVYYTISLKSDNFWFNEAIYIIYLFDILFRCLLMHENLSFVVFISLKLGYIAENRTHS